MHGFSKIKFFTFLLVILNLAFPVVAQENSKEIKEDGEKIAALSPKKSGRLPVIIIPGLVGSELVNKETGDQVWFDLGRADDDDLRLPISAKLKANRDKLVPKDILREIQLIRFTPKVDIYQKLIDSLIADGYVEGKFDAPPKNGFADTFYVFPYDWRLDNVENAHLLIQKLDGLRKHLKRPKQQFNVVSHSMGGLIARYAAMYGKAELRPNMRPNWAGASYFNNILLVAVPNGGSTSALNSLLNGFSLFGSGKINLPFIQNLTKYDLFTIPSIYQLLPHENMVNAYDEDLKPLKVDIYDPATWEKYGWTAYTDKEFAEKFTDEEQKQAKNYFRAVLARAKLFQAALDAKPLKQTPVSIYFLGSECAPTIDGMVIYKDAEKNVWKTEFEPDSFKKSDGTKVEKEELEKILYSPGDGVVPKRSLTSTILSKGQLRELKKEKVGNDLKAACSEHNRLTGDEVIGKSLLGVLDFITEPMKDKMITRVKGKR